MRPILDCTGYELWRDDVVRAVGASLYTRDGQRLVDFESGVWCAGLGHAPPRLQTVLHAQIDRVVHLGYRVESALAAEAARAVLASLPMPDGACLFLASGSEAVELAAQMARRVTRRPLLLGLSGAYLSAYGTTGERPAAEWIEVDGAACRGCARHDVCDPDCAHLAGIPYDRVAAFVFEPGNAGGRVLLPPRGPVRALAARVADAGGLLVVDEVTTGLGRTGTWYGFEHYGLAPDLVALGKGLGNGYPVSAVALRGDVADALRRDHFHYAQSHQDDPLGCAVAREVLSILRDEGLVERSAELGARFLRALTELAAQHTAVREARGRGLMLALEFQPDARPALADVHRSLLARGLLVGYKPQANLLRFYPPLVVDEADVDRLLASLDGILGAAL